MSEVHKLVNKHSKHNAKNATKLVGKSSAKLAKFYTYIKNKNKKEDKKKSSYLRMCSINQRQGLVSPTRDDLIFPNQFRSRAFLSNNLQKR